MRLGGTTGTSRQTMRAVLTSSVLRMGLSAPLAVLILPLALRRLSSAEYGVWAVLSAVLPIGYFAEAGIRTEMVKRIARARGEDDLAAIARTVREGTALMSLLAVVVAALGIVFSPELVSALFHAQHAIPTGTNAVLLCRLVMVLLGLSLVTAGAFAALEGLQRADWDNHAQAFGNVLGAVVSFTGLLIHWGLWSFVAGAFTQLLLGSAVRAVGMSVVLTGVPVGTTRMSVLALRSYIGVSTLVILSQVSNVFDYEFDKVLLARYVSAATAGLYDVGTSVALQARTVALLPLLVLLPAVAELSARQAPRALEMFVRVRTAIGAATTILLGGVVVLAPDLIKIWIGPGHAAAATSAQWLAAAMALNSVGAAAACYVIARGWTSLTALSSLVNIALNSVLSLLLTQRYGLHGALIGSVVANGAATLILLVLAARRETQLGVWPWLRPTVCGVGAVGIAMAVGLDGHSGGWVALALRGLAWLAISVVAVTAAGAAKPLVTLVRPNATKTEALLG